MRTKIPVKNSTVHIVKCVSRNYKAEVERMFRTIAVTCSIEYPEESEIKSKSHLSTPQRSNNQNPYVAYPPEPELKRKKTKIKGGLVSSYNYPEIILCNERITT